MPYAALRGRLARLAPIAGPAVLVALVLPWALAMERRAPGFLRYALVEETWQRSTTDAFHRTAPFWFFVPVVLLGTMPWSFVALPGLRALAGWRRRVAEPHLQRRGFRLRRTAVAGDRF